MRGESKGISRGLSAYADRNLTKFVAATSTCFAPQFTVHGTVVTPWSSIWIWTKGKRRWKICRALHVYLCFPVLAAILPMTDGQLVSHINHRALHSTVSSSVSQSLWQSVWQSLSKPKQIWQFTVVVVVGISNFNPPSDSIWGLLARPRPLRMPLPRCLSLPLAVPCPGLSTGYSLCIDTVVVVGSRRWQCTVVQSMNEMRKRMPDLIHCKDNENFFESSTLTYLVKKKRELVGLMSLE